LIAQSLAVLTQFCGAADSIPLFLPQALSWGLYPGQLHWLMTHFSRQQMLLLNFHAAAASSDPNTYLQEILDFFHIPAVAQLHEAGGLTHTNSATAAQSTDILDCDLHARLTATFAPYNEIFYAMEPEYGRFPPTSDEPCRSAPPRLLG
jgi:hypothetical protein